ncbi:MAG: retroviral-like aspartic protease family protein [Cylindrospermopsis raciborskii KL1]|uniref:retropepsin-like aspartic protease family protein n=1 Tax=Cylindrospermopsis raciborskii TaxID=77022 RepID=UPI001A2516CB|nr:retropepsin-like aspartic protease [Cylindrospermopsis raciborskii]MBG0742867.1 retroviral-like aspartic protease family protein [Cylindrospermopsis raciborskii KL1]
MLDSILPRTTVIVMTSALATLIVACTGHQQSNQNINHSRDVGNLTAVQPSKRLPHTQEVSVLELALDKGVSALRISRWAQSAEDWQLVESNFNRAIALLKQIRPNSPNFAFARKKIIEYEGQLQLARQQGNPSKGSSLSPDSPVVNRSKQGRKILYSPPIPVRETPTIPESPSPDIATKKIPTEKTNDHEQVYIVPIKRRIGGTPIVEVTFNGKSRFEMIVDTGASGSVITQEMARSLGVVPVGVARANTVSSQGIEFPIAYVDSMEVGGVMAKRVPVAIAGLALTTGLLGHDFFGNYDITIKRNVVEFRPQNTASTPVKIPRAVPTFPREYQLPEFP